MCRLTFVTMCLFILCILIVSLSAGEDVIKVESKFRILAPQFICPKDDNATVEKPDNTVITLQTAADADMRIDWTVRWTPLDAPTQRFTLLLWKAVRALEARLNQPQPEPYVYVIENSQMLKGVNYIFNVSSVESNGDVSEPKCFNIDNTQGDHELTIEGRSDMFSVVLVGAQAALADVTYVVEAQVTTCTPTQDYYFAWSVQSLSTDDVVNVSHIQGSRLEVSPHTLRPGLVYSASCQVIRASNGNFITQTSLPFGVRFRELEVYLSIDYLRVTINKPFSIKSIVINHDYYGNPVTFAWKCTYNDEDCNIETDLDGETLIFPSGLCDDGEYYITLNASVFSQTSLANATIVTVKPMLPVLNINPLARLLNEGSTVEITANASNVVPSCSLSWYFASEEYQAESETAINDTCEDCQHGEALTDTLTVHSLEEQFLSELADYTNDTECRQHGEALTDTLTVHSLEEQFLSELADYTNDTEWRQVTTTFPAKSGRTRFVAQCGCSLTFSCDTEGVVYADVWFQLNKSPKAGDVIISPESGTAMETEFRISTLPVHDPDIPLQYSFYCRIGDESLLLASYIEHRAVETILPYIEAGTEVWVQVCDAFGACSDGDPTTLVLAPGSARTVDALIDVTQAHVRRCEVIPLARIVQSAIVTYYNAGQSAALTKFLQALQKLLPTMDKNNCIIKHNSQYSFLLSWLAKNGIKTTELLYDT